MDVQITVNFNGNLILLENGEAIPTKVIKNNDTNFIKDGYCEEWLNKANEVLTDYGLSSYMHYCLMQCAYRTTAENAVSNRKVAEKFLKRQRTIPLSEKEINTILNTLF